MLQARRHPTGTEIERSPGDPFHIWHSRENAPNHREAVGVQQLAGLQPAEYLSRRFRERQIQRRTKLRARRTRLPGEMLFVSIENVPPLSARAILDHDKFHVGIILINNRPQRSLKP